MKHENSALRAIERSDLPLIQKWRNGEGVLPFVREYRLLSESHVEKWYDSIISDDKFEFFIIEDEEEKPIGVSGLTYIDWVNKNADLHLAIYEHEWIDAVYAPEVLQTLSDYAFNHLNLHRLYAEVYEIDYKKIDFFLKFGFQRDGVLRDHYYHNGSYFDSHIYSIIKS